MKQIDKVYHFGVCMVCMAVLGAWVMPFVLAVMVTLFVALCKEWYDRESYGHFCWWDILADLAGIIAGAGIAMWIGVPNWGV